MEVREVGCAAGDSGSGRAGEIGDVVWVIGKAEVEGR